MSIAHWYGNDIQLAPTGDVAIATGVDRVSQRLVRGILTAKQGYIWHPSYGLGAGEDVGKGLSPQLLKRIQGKFRGLVLSDPDIQKNPAPTLTFDTSTANLLGVTIKYYYAPSGKLQTLSFNVTP